MTQKQQDGYEMASGVSKYIAQMVFFGLVVWWSLCAFRNALDLGVDDSDHDGWYRSGLRVHVDYRTGVEYLSDGKGGLVVRQKGR